MARIGVIVGNLGTPKSPEPKDVASYLKEFLMDPYVIDIALPLRWFLVNVVITPFRSKTSSVKYKKVWSDDKGSPLLFYSQSVVKKLQAELGDSYKVVLAMRYGDPSMQRAKKQLEGCEKIIFFPQYPQFAESSFRTAEEDFKKAFEGFDYQVIPPYWNSPQFIEAYKKILTPLLKGISWDHLLMSFHGLPEKHLKKIDPTGSHCGNYETCCENSEKVIETCYRAQCFGTAKNIAGSLGIDKKSYTVSFQSRLGKQRWAPPYTDHMYKELADSGVKQLAVICPAFSADCLETLEEVAMEGKEDFLGAGGKEFHLLPCLNDHTSWIQACAEMIHEIT